MKGSFLHCCTAGSRFSRATRSTSSVTNSSLVSCAGFSVAAERTSIKHLLQLLRGVINGTDFVTHGVTFETILYNQSDVVLKRVPVYSDKGFSPALPLEIRQRAAPPHLLRAGALVLPGLPFPFVALCERV